MKKPVLLFSLLTLLSATLLQAQDTYIVTDNHPRVTSCDDTLISLEDIYELTGMHDLDDPSDDYTKYRMLELNGSVITANVITGSIHYSDYTQIYVEKTGTVFNGHNGVVIFLEVLNPPATLFDTDTLKYVVERGATKMWGEDFFVHLNLWSSGKDLVPLDERIFFTDLSTGTETTIKQTPNWTTLGKGTYRLRVEFAGCTSTDLIKDTIFVKITETPCHTVQLKNMPSVCLDDLLDITPYVYVDGTVATSSELADMTFYNRSRLIPGTDVTFDPTAMDVTGMYSTVPSDIYYPKIEIKYQPNIDLNLGCVAYTPMLDTKIPQKYAGANLVFFNNGKNHFQIEDTYYSFNNVFYRSALNRLFLDYYPTFAGTSFDIYSDNTFTTQVTGPDLSPGNYYIKATNPACSNDVSTFNIVVEENDFQIVWQSAANLGQGYYNFTVPVYAGATYQWQIWGGGSIISGLNTEQITVYYSQGLSNATTVSCVITLPSVRTNSSNTLVSKLYLMPDGDGGVMEIPQTVTGVKNGQALENISAYPNPADGTFTISGTGVYEVKVFNAMGEQVYDDAAYTANSPLTINSKGVHMVHLTQNGKRGTIKIVVQ